MMTGVNARRALLLGLALAAIGTFIGLFDHGPAIGGAAAGAQSNLPPTTGDSFEPQLGLPASGVVAFGNSTSEAPDQTETWAYGALGQTPIYIEGKAYSDQDVLLRMLRGNETTPEEPPTWQAIPLPQAPEGGPLGGSGGPGVYGALAGQATEDGGVVLLSGQSIIARDPGGAPTPLPEPQQGSPGSTAEQQGLANGESLLPVGVSGTSTVPYAAIEEEGRHVGVLLAPYRDGGKQNSFGLPEAQPGVLRYGGGNWTREPIDATGEALVHFTALAMSCSGTQAAPGASSPENCWLLAGYGARGPEHLALYRRSRLGASGWVWRPQAVSDWIFGSASPPSGVTSVSPLPQGAQMLTATSQGVWVDIAVSVNGQPAPVDVSELVFTPGQGGEAAKVAGAWCYPTGTVCSAERSLGAALPARYRSFAWPGTPADPGTRVITGLPEGALLELAGGAYSYTVGDGGEQGKGAGGAALYRNSPQAPVEGVLASGTGSRQYQGEDNEGQAQAIEITTHPVGDQLNEESVPFRHPLLALAPAPGTTPGDPSSEALAVGLEGQIGRYAPGQGWRPETLYNAEGKAQSATLRGVAWPEPKHAYAVGDNGTMWLWLQELGYWVSDPAKPFNFNGNLTAIAFDAGDSQLGFAVGKQGVLLKYGKSWEEITKQQIKQEAKRLEAELKIEEWRLNFTSVAFAGNEALATYRYVTSNEAQEAGGLLVYNEEAVCVQEDEALERTDHRQVVAGERGCWHTSDSASSLLAGLPSIQDTVLSKVAGLPDGGAVAAGPDLVMERESAGSQWHLSQTPLSEVENISALAAYREPSGPVRAIASVEVDRWLNPNENGTLQRGPFGGDVPVSTGPGQPPPLIPPDPLPNSGYVLKQTADGWMDMEHEALPVQEGEQDMPVRPDPVFALLVDPSGHQGLAVGGQTYDVGGGGPESNGETAGAMRFPAASGQSSATPSAVAAPAGQASFVVGGEAACAQACFALAHESIGPDVWLTHALQTAAQISPTPRAFLYTGHRTAGAGLGAGAPEVFERELMGFKELLAAGALPVDVDPSSDLMPGSIGRGPFERVLQPSGVTRGPAGTDAYALTSTGASGGPVRLIVLDYSGAELGMAQREWLQAQLCEAKGQGDPAIVMGHDALDFNLPDALGPAPSQALDAEVVSQLLVRSECHGSAAPYAAASAYIFDYPGVNVRAAVTYRGASIPAYGSGTLGPQPTVPAGSRDSLVSSGYLLLSVNTTLAARESDNKAPTVAQVIPNAGELSIDATEGTLLRRSHAALFEGLARRPPAGVRIGGNVGTEGRLIFPSAYDPIPHDCRGSNCVYEVPIEYTFTSSKPDVGGFVLHEAAAEGRPLQIQVNFKGQPVPDEPRDAQGELNSGDRFSENSRGEAVNERGEALPANRSALFCAYNQGTTTISLTTGGLTYSMPITVQGGSSEQPCGTVPLKNPPPRYEPATTPFVLPNPSTPGAAPVNPQINTLPPPPPPKVASPPPPHPHSPIPLPSQPGLLFPLPRIVPPPAPNLPRPTPPSGTAQVPSQSPVSQQVSVAEREEEVEGAYQHVHNMAAYDRLEGESTPTWPLALIVIAAAAGAGLRPRRDRESPVYAWVRGWRKDL